MAEFALIGAAWKVAEGTKKCLDFLQSFKGIHEEGYVLWQTIEALTEPLQIAMELRSRQVAFNILKHPVQLCSFVLGTVEKLIEKEDGEEGRPNSRDSWRAWISSKKDGKERKERIVEILPKLTHAICALNLALTALQCRVDVRQISFGSSFTFVPDAFRGARRLLQEFEFGRLTHALVCHCILWKTEHHSGSSMLVEKGKASVSLQESGETLALRFECIADEDDEPWKTETVTIMEDSVIRCTWKSKVPDLDTEGEGIAFYIDNVWMEYFPAYEGLSAESFEALLTLLRLPRENREAEDAFLEQYWQKNHW